MEKTIGQYFEEMMNGEELSIERINKMYDLISNAKGDSLNEKIDNVLLQLN